MMNRKIFIPVLICVFCFAFHPLAAQDKEGKPQTSERFRALFSSLKKLEVLEEKVELLEAFLRDFPRGEEHNRVKFRLGWEYFMARKDPEAERIFRAVARDARKPELVARALQHLGRSLMNLGESLEARRVFTEVIARFPESPEVPLAEGCIHELDYLQVGMAPPVLEGKDMNGAPFSLKKYRGRVTLIYFWALSSIPSLKEMDQLMQVYQMYGRAGFDVLAVSLDTKVDHLEKFLKEEKIPWRIVCDGKGWKSRYARLYNVYRMPASILLDRKGIIRFKNLKGTDLEGAVKKIIGQ